MNTKLKLAGLMLIAGTAVSGQAQARDPVVGAMLGAGAGAFIGAAIGGHEGAAVGGIIGAVAGATMSHSRVVVETGAPVYPATGQYAGGYVPTHGPVYGPVYGPAGGYRDNYPDRRYDDRHGYNRYRTVRCAAGGSTVSGTGCGTQVMATTGTCAGYRRAAAGVIYRETYPHHYRHHDRYCGHHPRDWRAY